MLMGVDVLDHPEAYAYLFGMTLLGNVGHARADQALRGGEGPPDDSPGARPRAGRRGRGRRCGLGGLLDMGPMNPHWDTVAVSFVADHGNPREGATSPISRLLGLVSWLALDGGARPQA